MSYFAKASSSMDGRVFSTLPVFIYETRRGSVYQMRFTTLGDVRLLGHWIQSWESWLNWI